MIVDNFPQQQDHTARYIAVGPDNKLYVGVGASGGRDVVHNSGCVGQMACAVQWGAGRMAQLGLGGGSTEQSSGHAMPPSGCHQLRHTRLCSWPCPTCHSRRQTFCPALPAGAPLNVVQCGVTPGGVQQCSIMRMNLDGSGLETFTYGALGHEHLTNVCWLGAMWPWQA